jgi:nicotinamidase/pyrazinamidase
MSETDALRRSPNGSAIIVVDPQPDFFEGGPLPVSGATRTAEEIAQYLRDRGGDFDLRIVTQDWHVDPGDHWSEHPDFVTTWPVHCAANTDGASIHEALAHEEWDAVIHKGSHEGAYSGFEGSSDSGLTLAEILATNHVRDVTVVGFATDHCVKATAIEARALGLEVTVVLDLCAGVDPETTLQAISAMRDAGITVEAPSERSDVG